MKRSLVLVLVLVAAFAWASGEKEAMEIDLLGFGWSGAGLEPILEKAGEEFPWVTFTRGEVDVATGEDIVMASRIAAGLVPDVYGDFVGRAGKYVTEAFALPLKADVSQWYPGVLDWYTRGGKVLAYPESAPGQAMVLNVTLLEKAGWAIPEGIESGWTVEAFIEMAEAFKASGVDGYATGLFAGNPSADYLWLNWAGSFGLKSLYADEYRKTLVGSEEMRQMWRFFEWLSRSGMVDPESYRWTASDFLKAIGTGKMAAYGTRMSWPSGMQANYNAGGEHYEWVAVPFPTWSGEPAPVCVGPHIVVAHKTKDAGREEVLQRLTFLLATYWQGSSAENGALPSLKSVEIPAVVPKGEEIVRYAYNEAGILDVGFPNSWYYESRAIGPEVLQKLLRGEISGDQAHQEYFQRISALIAR